MNDNLPFVIPGNQSTRATKGGGKGYTYFGDPTHFERHKQSRAAELRKISEDIKKEVPAISNPEQLAFLDIELDTKATSKSSIPVDLFDDFGLDVNKRTSRNELIVAGSSKDIEDFSNKIRNYRYIPQENDPGNYKNREASLLSSIKKISRVSTDQKIDGKIEKENLGVAYFYKSISELDAKKITDTLVKTQGIKAKYMVSPSGAKLMSGHFTKEDIDLIINEDYQNPFAKFEVMHHVGVVTKSMNTTYPITNATVNKDAADVTIGVIDSGIEALDVFDGLIVGRKDYTSDPDSDKQHGTMVASRLIFGNDIEDQLFDTDQLTARAKVVDIKVVEGEVGPTPVDLIANIEDALKEFPDVKAWSMSVGTDELCKPNKKTYLTRELDALSHKYGVMFIVAAGNRDDFYELTLPYPDLLFDIESVLNPPADLTNGISVGSLADKANRDSLAQVNEPSPFTRVGFDGIRKPDLTHYGGNARKSGVWRDLGVKGMNIKENELYEDVGTSHATPLVSGELAAILRVVNASGYDHSISLAKAMLVHSAGYIPNETSLIDPKDLDKVVGHGVPDPSSILFSDPTQVVYVITDTIGGINPRTKKREAARKIRFTIPPELKDLKRDLNVRATLGYFSPIDANDDVDTALCDIGMTLHKKNSRDKLVNSARSDEADYSYKPKWHTVKCLERTYSPRSYNNGDWEISLALQTRGDADTDDFEQPFALVITVEDVGKDGERINLQEIIKNNHKQYVRLNEIKVKQRISTGSNPLQ